MEPTLPLTQAAATLTGPTSDRAAAQGSMAIQRRISSLTKPIREGLRSPGRVMASLVRGASSHRFPSHGRYANIVQLAR